MALDLYHQILHKLYESTGDDDKKVVDLVQLIRKEGYSGAFDDIYGFLQREGWIVEARSYGSVRITGWGIAEVKRTKSGGGAVSDESLRSAGREAKNASDTAREFAELLDEWSKSLLKPDTARAAELKTSVLQKVKVINDAVSEIEKLMSGK
jgi:hypothetical protein